VFADDPRLSVSRGTLAALARATDILRERGATVHELAAPWDQDPTELFFDCVAADGGSRLIADLEPAAGRHHPMMTALMKAVSERSLTATQWFAVQSRVHRLRSEVRALASEVDVLVCPVVAGPAPRHGEPPGGLLLDHELRAFDYVHLIALAGLPAASIPVGSEDGLPIGVQVAAAPYREDVVLAVGAALEADR
jgi:Asp-tRNA(Asn)/Glu-tRNA(Gln) amidotransferase A subunit family amidase